MKRFSLIINLLLMLFLTTGNISGWVIKAENSQSFTIAPVPTGKCRIYFIMPLGNNSSFRIINYYNLEKDSKKTMNLGSISPGSYGTIVIEPGKYGFNGSTDHYQWKMAEFRFKADQVYFIKVTTGNEVKASSRTYQSAGKWYTETTKEVLGTKTFFDSLSEKKGLDLLAQCPEKANITDFTNLFVKDPDMSRKSLKFNNTIGDILLSPDGKILASACGPLIQTWDLVSGEQLINYTATAAVTNIVFSPDCKIIATNSGKTIELRDAVSGKVLTTLAGHSEPVISIVFDPSGKKLATGSFDKSVKIWDVSKGTQSAILTGHSDIISEIAYIPDGKVIVSASNDKTGKIWNPVNGALITTLTGHTDKILQIRFSPDGKIIATRGNDRTIRLWNAGDGTLLTIINNNEEFFTDIAFSPDSKTIASVSTHRFTKIWSVADGKMLAKLTGHTGVINTVAFSPDGKTVASGGLKAIILWDVTNGKLLTTLSGHMGYVKKIQFSPDGKTLVSSSMDRTVKIWDLP